MITKKYINMCIKAKPILNDDKYSEGDRLYFRNKIYVIPGKIVQCSCNQNMIRFAIPHPVTNIKVLDEKEELSSTMEYINYFDLYLYPKELFVKIYTIEQIFEILNIYGIDEDLLLILSKNASKNIEESLFSAYMKTKNYVWNEYFERWVVK